MDPRANGGGEGAREGGLPKAGGAAQEDVTCGLAAREGGLGGEAEVRDDALLADDVVEAGGSERGAG
jgi:hypothetical protein